VHEFVTVSISKRRDISQHVGHAFRIADPWIVSQESHKGCVPLSIAVATPIAQLHECIAVGATKLHVDTKIIAMSTVFVSKHGVVKGIPLSTPIVDIIKPLRDVRSDVFRNPLSPTQRTLLLGVGHVLEQGLQTLETNEVRAAFDVDDLGADVLFNALDADGALGVGRVGGVRV
jgi:hypothetical protein